MRKLTILDLEKIHNEVCENVINCATNKGFSLVSLTTAPIDKEKNLEDLSLIYSRKKINYRIQTYPLKSRLFIYFQ